MVLFAAGRIKKLKEEGRQEGLQEGHHKGLHEGRQAERQKWEAWYRRFLEAQANGQPFNEPPPPQG